MKKTILILVLLALHASIFAQFYLRGEVRDEKNSPLSNAKIRLHSTGYVYYSGTGGSFGITTAKKIDSVTVQMDGYHPLSLQIDAEKYQTILLKILFASADIRKNRLLSFTKNLKPEDRQNWTISGETYSSQIENEFVNSKKYPETGFAIHTDKAAYSNIRRFLNMGTTIPADAAHQQADRAKPASNRGIDDNVQGWERFSIERSNGQDDQQSEQVSPKYCAIGTYFAAGQPTCKITRAPGNGGGDTVKDG